MMDININEKDNKINNKSQSKINQIMKKNKQIIMIYWEKFIKFFIKKE